MKQLCGWHQTLGHLKMCCTSGKIKIHKGCCVVVELFRFWGFVGKGDIQRTRAKYDGFMRCSSYLAAINFDINSLSSAKVENDL
jgi:hypothetical protein